MLSKARARYKQHYWHKTVLIEQGYLGKDKVNQQTEKKRRHQILPGGCLLYQFVSNA